MSAANDIMEYLQAQGVGTIGAASGWSLHIAREPDAPDSTVTIYDTGGPSQADPDNGVYEPSIQIRCRANDYNTAHAKAEEARDALIASETGFTANGVTYIGAWSVTEPTSLGYDDHDRARVVVNVNLMYEV